MVENATHTFIWEHHEMTDSIRLRRTRYDNWNSTAVTEITTEWTNVFYYPHNEGDPWHLERCPAFLVQECTSYDLMDDNLNETTHQCERTTRVVFATASVDYWGHLEPAVDEGDNYLGTFPGPVDEALKAGLVKRYEATTQK
jgi:hypothetical protein